MVTDIYKQYFKADAEFSGVRRNGALVTLTSDSEAGFITYKAAVTFFPHRDEEDYAFSYDAFFEKELFSGKGRRSRKREAKLLSGFRGVIDGLAAENGAKVIWDEPLREEIRA